MVVQFVDDVATDRDIDTNPSIQEFAALSLLDRFVLKNNQSGLDDTKEEMQILGVDPDAQGSGQVMMLGSRRTDIIKDLLSDVPKDLLTPEVKAHLETLAAFAKAGPNATPEKQQEAIAAYKAIGKQLKVAIAKTIISYGIKTGLAETPAAPASGVIANITAGPLAEVVVATTDKSSEIQLALINKALLKMGKKPIDTTNRDLFMTKLVAKFSGNILAEIKRQEHSSGPKLRARAGSHAEEVAAATGSDEITR